jgi:hypothetical protein
VGSKHHTIITVTLAFILAVQPFATHAQTGGENTPPLPMPAPDAANQPPPQAEPSAAWPEVTERLQSVQAKDATLETPATEAPQTSADDAIIEQPAQPEPDMVLAAPAQANTPQRAIAVSAQVNQVTLQGKAQFIPSPATHGQINGGDVSPLGVQFKR